MDAQQADADDRRSFETMCVVVARMWDDGRDPSEAMEAAFDRAPERSAPPEIQAAAPGTHRFLSSHALPVPSAGLASTLLDDTAQLVFCAWLASQVRQQSLRLSGLLAALPVSLGGRLCALRYRLGPAVDALATAPLLEDSAWLDADVSRRLGQLAFEADASELRVAELATLLQSQTRRALAVRPIPAASMFERAVAARLAAIAADGFGGDGPAAAGLEDWIRGLALDAEPTVWRPAAQALGRLAGTGAFFENELLGWIDASDATLRRRGLVAAAAARGLGARHLYQRIRELGRPQTDVHELAAIGLALPALAAHDPVRWEGAAWALVARGGAAAVASAAEGLLRLAEGGRTGDTRRELLEQVFRRADEALMSPLNDPIEAAAWWRARWRAQRGLTVYTADEDLEGWRDHLLGRPWPVGDAGPCAAARLLERTAATWSEVIATLGSATDAVAEGKQLVRIDAASELIGLAPWLRMCNADEGTVRTDRALRDRIWRDLDRRLTADLRGFGPRRALLRAAQRLFDAESGGAAGRPSARGHAAARLVGLVTRANERVDCEQHADARRRRAQSIASTTWRLRDAATQPAQDAGARAIARISAWWTLFHGPTPVADASRHEHHYGVTNEARESIDDASRALVGAVAAAEDADSLAPHLHAVGLHGTGLGGALTELVTLRARQARGDASPRRRDWEAVRARLAACAGDLGVALAPTPVGAAARAPDFSPIAPIPAAALGPILEPIVAVAESGASVDDLPAQDSPAPAPPPRIGPYTIERELGRGGQSVVFLVRRPDLDDRRFALKMPVHLTERRRRREWPAAFRVEVARLAQISDPHVVEVVDRGWHANKPYLVVTYYPGATLTRFLTPPVPPESPVLLRVVRDTCHALTCLARHGLVHRDVKPDNLLVQLPIDAEASFDPSVHAQLEPVRVVLLDFGVTAGLDPGTSESVAGTLGYIPPEVFQGVPHPRSDIYSLASIVHWALTGHCFHAAHIRRGAIPFMLRAGRNPPDLSALQATRAPLALVDLLRRASAMDPDTRPDPATFAAELAAAVGRP